MTHRLMGGRLLRQPSWPLYAVSARGPCQTNSQPSLPRTPDGRPDLTGIWQVVNTAAWDIQDHWRRRACPPGKGSWRAMRFRISRGRSRRKKENFKNRLTADPVEAKCFLPGVPRVMYMPYPFQIVQTPKHIAMLYEYAHANRTIYTDGSPHLAGAIDSFWMGDSRGRWEGDTLVVDVDPFQRPDVVRPGRQFP